MLDDPDLSASEQRAILSSWASDACAVESVPALRHAPFARRPVTFDEIIIHLRDLGLNSRKLPEQIEVVEALPRNTSGKVLKHVLRDEFKG